MENKGCTDSTGIHLFCIGCASTRVVIRDVPAKDAPLDERLAAFEKLKPAEASTAFRLSSSAEGSFEKGLLLTDGTFVSDPRDLAPAVENDSSTAVYTNSYIQHKQERKELGTVSKVLLAIGGGGIVATIAVASVPNPNPDANSVVFPTALTISALVAFISAAVAGIAGIGPNAKAAKDRLGAFQNYRKSLLKRLDLKDPLVKEPDPELGKAQSPGFSF
jgi:hypothetical protein